MDNIKALPANLPPGAKGIAGSVVGNGANRESTEDAESGVMEGRIVMDGDFLKIREGLIEKLILLVIAAKEQAKIPATGIEGPLMSEKALQGAMGRMRVSTVAQQGFGFIQGQLHGKGWERA